MKKITSKTVKTVSIKLAAIALAVVVLGASSVSAIELVVSGNGEGSDNEITTQVETSTQVEQSNQADINNEVETTANTGGNTASSNLGEVDIQTGDIETSTQIVNENINSNNASLTREGLNLEATITGNGSETDNTINGDVAINYDVSQNNVANIENNVVQKANTGENVANNNNGDVEINTGDITAEVLVENVDINTSDDPHLGISSFNFAISDNGANSTNSINFSINDTFDYSSNNLANIINNIVQVLDTGNNEANGNLGNVSINTGDIFSRIGVLNDGVNCNSFNSPLNCGRGGPGDPNSPPPVGGSDPSDPGDPGTSLSDIFGTSVAAASEGGGESILGLSNTGGEHSPALFFAGVAMLAAGTWVLGREALT